jgi:N-acetylmuramoyl-L-alanine amidase
MKVGIDAGHGGRNLGTHGLGFPEKQYTLDRATELSKALKDAGFETILVRSSDETVFFLERAKRLKAADIVISLHVNAYPDPKVHGYQTFYMPTKDSKLAECLLGHVPKELQRKNEKARPATLGEYPAVRFCIERYTQPTALIELGFATNEKDREYLLSDAGKKALVDCIVEGIKDYASAL